MATILKWDKQASRLAAAATCMPHAAQTDSCHCALRVCRAAAHYQIQICYFNAAHAGYTMRCKVPQPAARMKPVASIALGLFGPDNLARMSRTCQHKRKQGRTWRAGGRDATGRQGNRQAIEDFAGKGEHGQLLIAECTPAENGKNQVRTPQDDPVFACKEQRVKPRIWAINIGALAPNRPCQ